MNTIYIALGRVLGSPGKQIDVRAIEEEPYSADVSITDKDNWLERFRKKLWGSSPFVSGFAGGCLMSILAGIFSNGLALLGFVCLFLGQGGQTGLTALSCIQFPIWIVILYALLRSLKKTIRGARLYQPSGEGLALGIGLYLLLNVLLVIFLFSSAGR